MSYVEEAEVFEPVKAPRRKAIKEAPAPDMDVPEGHVRVRVTKHGHGLIFTGETKLIAKERFPTYSRDDVITLPAETAEIYEDKKHWVEIL